MDDPVSRETPAPPAQASAVFGSTLGRAQIYANLLSDIGVERGLLGPREVPRVWERHLINCAVIESAFAPGLDVCDVGSGAGLPGLVLGLCRPDLQVTLVEPLERRTVFLGEAVAALGLRNVEVVRARAEALHGRRDFAAVTSRAVAPLDRLLPWSLPLVRPGGHVVAMKGRSADKELARARPVLKRLSAGRAAVDIYGEGIIDPPTRVVRVEKPGHRD